MSIFIPVTGSDEVVEVNVNELPEDEGEVVDILQAELAPLDLWLRFAVEYYRQGRLDSFANLLKPLTDLHEQEKTQGAGNSMLFEQFGKEAHVKKAFLDILNALAAFHTVLGSRERDKTKRKTEFDKAKRFYDSAETLDPISGGGVGRGVLEMQMGKMGRAEKTLTEIEAFNTKSVPAILGRACAKYNGGNFREALKLYRRVFDLNPTPPPTVRLGLGYCYSKLGQSKLAQKSLERTLELQEDSVDAMVGLAVLHLNEDRVSEALSMLKRAYELEPYNPSVLNHLASHYFYRAQYAKALTLANRAYSHSEAKAIKAESCYHMARCHHAQGNFQAALLNYAEAHRTNPDYVAPQFGLGQMHMVNNEIKKAAQCFERVLRAQPNNTDAHKVLGHLHRREGRHEEALEYLTKAADHSPNDAAVWLELAQLQQARPGQLAAALKAYEKAAGILKRPPSTVPPELWSNLGTVRHRLGKHETAEQAYGYAIKMSMSMHGVAEFDPKCLTTQFNLGRLYEDMGQVDKAAAKYMTILEHHPSYPDCFIRLAACAEASGDPNAAIGWATKELHLHPKRADAFCMLGNIYLGMGDLKRADAQFKNVLERAEDDGPPGSKPVACKRDSYATGQLAWIQIQLAQAGASPAASILKACASASGVERLDKATEMLKKVLQAEPNNVFAANAIGVICVARGRLNEARQIFTQVREASPSCEAATANLAQINAALGEHATAVSFYDQIFKRAKAALDTTGGAGGDAAAGAGAASGGSSAGGVSEQRETLTTMLLLQARSHHTSGKLAEAKSALYRAVRLAPSSHASWHNLGLALLTSARHPDGPDAPPRSTVDVAAAQADARTARELLQCLNPALVAGDEGAATGDATPIEVAESDDAPVPPSKAALASGEAAIAAAEGLGLTLERRRAALRSSEGVLTELSDEAERASEREEREAVELAAADAKMAEFEQARLAAKAEEEARKKAEEDAYAAKLAEQRERLAAKMESWREKDAAAAAADAAGKRKAKKKAGGEDGAERSDNSDDDDPMAGPGGAANVGGDDEKDADADAADDLFGSDDDDDAPVLPADDDGEGGGDEAAAKKARKEAKKARKAEKAERKEKKRLRKAGADADDGGGDDAVEDLFGDDDDDDGVAGGGEGGESSRLTKRRKVVMDDDDDDDDDAPPVLPPDDDDDDDVPPALPAGDPEDDLFGDDGDDAAEGGGGGSASAPTKKRARVLDDDDDD